MRGDLAKGAGRGIARGVAFGALLTLCAGSLAAQAAARGPEQAIRARRESSNQAIAKHDTAGIAATLATDVIVVTSRSAKTIGRNANATAFAEQFRDRPDVVYRRTPDEVAAFEPWGMASERGRWTGSWTDADGKISLTGTYFAKWRLIKGEWFVESETYVPTSCTGGKYCRTVP